MTADLRTTSLYTTEQTRRIDRAAIERIGIDGYLLMERAAAAAFASLRRHWPAARRITLHAGNGNNGGDAFLLGRMALQAGFAVDALVLSPQSNGADAQRARAEFVAAGGSIRQFTSTLDLQGADVHVDGLFGIGLARAANGAVAEWIDRLNASGRPILALDVPSGLDADTGTRLGPSIRAAATVSFVAWKRGLFTADAGDCCGMLELATLDIPPSALDGIPADCTLMDATVAAPLAPRSGNVNKSSYGHVLAIGGDDGMAGAIRLSSEAALRTGAGLVSVATRAAHVSALNAARPELMARGVDDAAALAPLLERASVVAIGPGLGQHEWGQALFDAALASDKPLVLDADGLNLLAKKPRRLRAEVVLTPHPGEAARLLGCDTAAIQRDRFAAVRELASRYAAVVVLKGAGSLVADCAGQFALCPWGNPGMASGGMGDVLTGVIAALLAQKLSAWDAARLGVALHARAGDLAAADMPRGLVASDLFEPLRRVANRFPE